MNPTSVDLSLSLKPSYVPKSISNLLEDLSKIDNESDKLSVLSDYICKHQEELSTVEALKRELPQCRLLLMDDAAIEALKEGFKNIEEKMECQSRQPLVEYLPTMRKNRNEQDQREFWQTYSAEEEYWNPIYAKKQKTLVLGSFQPPNLKAVQPCTDRNVEGLGLLSYKECSSNSLGSPSTGKGKEVAIDQLSRHQSLLYLKVDDQTVNYHPKPLTQPIWKNNRRCWSSELHARFVEALNLLGGIEVATPKQIRDLMQVEGLTIDQVKSHLQVEFDLIKLNNACMYSS
ncbi:transcription factor HHO5-like [Herrania umbratica]|uniref:Transcription factor HHO5-like n=1 Tax=Herrania umbratica TaxID=108875 RepID=A0A6J1BBV4_9ROSI|nr:transcription factor HHO5-like [Herrania umbratica]